MKRKNIFLFNCILLVMSLYASANKNLGISSILNDNTITIHTRSYHEEKELRSKEFSLADIDGDGITDSLYYDFDRHSLRFLLSTRNYTPLFQEYDLEEVYADFTSINANEGGFSITSLFMRSWSYDSYQYEPEKSRFRLSAVMHENYGNAANDGSGTWSLNLLNSDFNAQLNFYDYENDSLIAYPPISMIVENDPVYLGDTIGYHIPDYEFFEIYRNEYHPAYNDTVKYINHDYTYDYAYFIGEKDGEYYRKELASDYDNIPNRGDIVSVRIEIFCYQEPGDKSIFYVKSMIRNLSIVQKGRFSLFIQENKKPIDYHSISGQHWEDSPEHVEYFLANTTDKKILKYLRKPGRLDVELLDSRDEYSFESSEKFLLARITNVHNGKRKHLHDLYFDNEGEYVKYYILDTKTGKYVELNI